MTKIFFVPNNFLFQTFFYSFDPKNLLDQRFVVPEIFWIKLLDQNLFGSKMFGQDYFGQDLWEGNVMDLTFLNKDNNHNHNFNGF